MLLVMMDEDEDDEDEDVEDCGQEGGVCGHYGQVEDIMWTVHTILFMFSLYSLYIFISAIYVLALEFLFSQCCLFRICFTFDWHFYMMARFRITEDNDDKEKEEAHQDKVGSNDVGEEI